MSTTFVKIPYTEKVELRQQANYWKFVHGCAVECEAVLKEEARVMEDTIRDLHKTTRPVFLIIAHQKEMLQS